MSDPAADPFTAYADSAMSAPIKRRLAVKEKRAAKAIEARPDPRMVLWRKTTDPVFLAAVIHAEARERDGLPAFDDEVTL